MQFFGRFEVDKPFVPGVGWEGIKKQAGGCGEGSPRLPQPRGAEPAAGEESPTGVTVPLLLASDSTHGVGS